MYTPRFWFWVQVTLCVLIGAAWLFYAGAAEINGSAQSLLLLPMVLIGCGFALFTLKLILSIIARDAFDIRANAKALVPFAVGGAFFILSCGIDWWTEWRSMKRGDELVEKIEQYKKNKGSYPSEVKDFMKIEDWPVTVVRGSGYRYQGLSDAYYISFVGTHGRSCGRGEKSPEWHCYKE